MSDDRYDQAGSAGSTHPPSARPGRSIAEIITAWCLRRWYLLAPLALVPVLWLARILSRARDIGRAERTERTDPITPARAAEAREEITRRADQEIAAVRARADDMRRRLRDRYGSGDDGDGGGR